MRTTPPYLSVAALAEGFSIDPSGRLTIERLIDRVKLHPFRDGWAGTLDIVVVVLYRGGVKGEPHEVRCVMVDPDEKVGYDQAQTIRFERGVLPFDGIFAQVRGRIVGLGTHRMDVYLDGELDARVPFEAIADPDTPVS